MELYEQSRCRALNDSSSFCRTIYSEIEEIGWEHLVRLGTDLTFLSFRIKDTTGRVHILELQLDETYPKRPPSVSADLPLIPDLEWSRNSRLKDLVSQFEQYIEKFQEFWSILDDIDKSFSIVHPKQPSRAICFRQVNIGTDCFIMLFVNPTDPTSLPECRFIGSGPISSSLRMIWQRNSKRWTKEKRFLENLACVLETQLPMHLDVQMKDQLVECGICYARCLPVDDKFGTKYEIETDYTCENSSCSKAFHRVCLAEWLRSITTTKQSFNMLFGKCPYCSDPVAVEMENANK